MIAIDALLWAIERTILGLPCLVAGHRWEETRHWDKAWTSSTATGAVCSRCWHTWHGEVAADG